MNECEAKDLSESPTTASVEQPVFTAQTLPLEQQAMSA
jgi:hypothetical protein